MSGVGVKLDKLTHQRGRTLMVDPATEPFTGECSKEANAFLTREYRKSVLVPEKV